MTAITVIGNGLTGGSTERPEAASDSPVVSADGGIIITERDIQVDVYIDAMCPICATFDETYMPVLEGHGAIGVTVHPISILDRYSNGIEYSTRAAAAAYAVAG